MTAQEGNTLSLSKGFAPILVIVLMLACLAIGAGGYYLYSKNNSSNFIETIPLISKQEPVSLEGKTIKLDKDLGLIIQTSYEKENNMTPSVVYYSAGTYTGGQYKGYTRYIAIRGAIDPSGASIYTFASNDGQKYILDKSTLPNTDTDNSIEEINQEKIEKTEVLPASHPEIINLDKTFALNRNKIPTKLEETGKKDKYGNDDMIEVIDLDALNNSSLKSPLLNINLFSDKNNDSQQNTTDLSKQAAPYLNGLTVVTGFNATGLPFTYDLTRPKLALEYPAKYEKYQIEIKTYMKSEDPDRVYPDYPLRPNLRLEKSEIATKEPIYNKYDLAMPHQCALDVNTWFSTKISDVDLTKLATSPEGDLFILKDKNHVLNKYQYQMKVGEVDQEGFAEVNKMPKPTYDNYVAQNPLLFLKDFWGRWVILGEYDVKLIGGCGKPVIYLYPEKPMEITARFLLPMNFDITIPNYSGGWKVLANPDGILEDLKPGVTDCQKIDITKKGSAYAKSACEAHKYPYLYWAGSVVGSTYPNISEGWVVAKEDITGFLENKLSEIGFNNQERQDFLEYWVPELNSKDSPFYKISFLQTDDLNKMFPMEINPKPVSTYRLFMDYQIMDKLPEILPKPQNLERIKRDGFTLIEWGGLKR